MSIDNDIVRCVSIDVGRKNLAFYTEDVSMESMQELKKEYKKLPKLPKRINDKLNKPLADFIDTMYTYGVRVDGGMGVFDIRENKNSDELDIATRVNLIKLLKDYRWLWDSCDTVVIEAQFICFKAKSRGGGANIKAIKIAECILFWFIEHYNNTITPVLFGSSFKTQLLGAPQFTEKKSRKTGKMEKRKMAKLDRKKWSIMEGKRILELREDKDALIMLDETKRGKQKLDDVCDCIVQLQAYILKTMIM